MLYISQMGYFWTPRKVAEFTLEDHSARSVRQILGKSFASVRIGGRNICITLRTTLRDERALRVPDPVVAAT